MPARKKRKTSKKRSTRGRKSARRTKKSSAKKVAVRKVARSTTPVRSAYNKSQLFTEIAGVAALTRKQVSSVFEELGYIMNRHLRSGAAGEFTLPSLLKCVVKRKPATKARKGINPFTGEMITFKAKPARNVVKVRALKKLKEMVK